MSLPRMFLAVQVYRPLSSYWTSCTVSAPNITMVSLDLFTEYLSVSCSSDVLMTDVVAPVASVNVQSSSWSGKANAPQTKVALLPSLISNWSSGGPRIVGGPRGKWFTERILILRPEITLGRWSWIHGSQQFVSKGDSLSTSFAFNSQDFFTKP